ncbi:MAG: ABC transporter permease [Chitinophagaceae bacterium]
MNLIFNITLAFRAIRNNLLRSVLTILIIGIGIMALVGILTGIEVIKSAVTSNFSSMGANSFQVTSDILKTSKRKQGGMEISRSEGKSILYDEAKAFKDQYPIPAKVSISMSAGGIATVSFGEAKTNPNIRIMGIDNEYFDIASTEAAAGRTFSNYEQESGSYVCVLGHGIGVKLFKDKWANAVGKMISLDGIKLRVVGVAEEKGGNMFSSADNFIFLPLNTARALFGGNSFAINVAVNDVAKKEVATDEAEGTFRPIRKVPLGTASNFSINQNDSIAKMLLENISTVNWAAVLIGLVTLLGSVIGLMNIMLVSVAERTREIGVSKALGAKNATIKGQFLTESILISLLGGAVGVILGVLAGNLFGLILHTGFVIPWLWMFGGISLCAAVGILSGIYPAIKASRLDPIEALRYE